MGSGMTKIVPGLYVGNFRDSKDEKQLKENNITHILAIHDNAKKLHEDKEYLCIVASDIPGQDLRLHFKECLEFIHNARLMGGNVLVHCLAGISRSVTITAAYIMTTTNLGWRESLNAIRGARRHANPNFGFQRQLQDYEQDEIEKERQQFRDKFPENPFKDEADCRALLKVYQDFILHGDSQTDSAQASFSHSEFSDAATTLDADSNLLAKDQSTNQTE